ncbi:hypothetical protein RIF29_05959 [Crotalaria pallida]|uniref:Uncharacterized protein n=1 Tax=Crotalaria pallida TaxID=3830 RepID=A0AAN9PA23_CROPI
MLVVGTKGSGSNFNLRQPVLNEAASCGGSFVYNKWNLLDSFMHSPHVSKKAKTRHKSVEGRQSNYFYYQIRKDKELLLFNSHF